MEASMRVSWRAVWSIGLFELALSPCLLQPAWAAAPPDCWDITFGAIQHRAAAPHPPFITYSETLEIQRDGLPFMRSRASIAYRDDGVVRIADDRFSDQPYVATATEPGPPELGPYRDRRSAWLPLPEVDYNLPLIGRVRSKPRGITCEIVGRESYRGHDTYHLDFVADQADKPSLKALWIDARTGDIWKVILSGFVPVVAVDENGKTLRLTDYEVELEQSGPYVVVDHVTWKYSDREYSQTSRFFGEYYYSGYGFPAALPASYFAG